MFTLHIPHELAKVVKCDSYYVKSNLTHFKTPIVVEDGFIVQDGDGDYMEKKYREVFIFFYCC